MFTSLIYLDISPISLSAFVFFSRLMLLFLFCLLVDMILKQLGFPEKQNMCLNKICFTSVSETKTNPQKIKAKNIKVGCILSD